MKIPNPNYLIAKVIAHFAITMVMGILFLETARAALTWNQGGGNWDTTSANWTGDATTFISDGTQDVIFDNAAGGTITISASMQPKSTTVSATSGTYIFNSGPITGSGGLTKSGDGQLTMNTANNSYTGKTSIERGTLLFGGAAYLSNADSPGVFGAPAAGANATIDLHNGVTLRSNGSNPRVNQSTNRPLNLAGSGYGTVSIRYNDNDASLTFGDVTVTGTGEKVLKVDTGINGNGDRQAINFTGGIANSTDDSPTSLEVTFNTQGSSNWVSLAGNNTFTGPITLSQINGTANGVLVVGGFRAAVSGANTIGTGSLGSGNYPGDITLGARTVLEYDSTAPQTLSGAISGAGAILLTGSGPVTLSGASSYSGNTTVNSGCSLTLGSTGSFGFLLGNTTTNKITGAGSATLNGTFSVDTSAVTAVTGSWTLVDATTRSYGTSFGLTDFTGPVGTVYTKQDGTKIWTFDTSTSALSLTSTAVFTSFTYNGYSGVIDHVNGTIKLPVSSGTAAATVAPIFTLTSGSSSSVSGAAPTWDSNNEATYTITDTSTDPAIVNVYTVKLNILPVPPGGVANGMMLWLAADDIDPADTSQVDNSGNVQQWNDLSGNSRNASNTTASQRPAYITNAMNGKPALRFNQDASSKLFLGDLSASFWANIADTYPTAVNSGTGGTGINGTYVNLPTRAVTGALVGDSDTATALNGSNQSVSIPYSASLNPPQGQPWSAEIWAKSNVAGVLPPFSSGTPGNVTNRQGWVLYFFNSDLSFRAYTNNGANATINGGNGLTIPGVITPQTWYHVVVTCDGTDFKIFLNGVEVGTTPTVGPNGTYSAGTAGTGLGIRVGAGNYFNGVLDEAAFYTTTLSQPRIQAHYDNGINNPERSQAYDLEIAADSPVAHYKLNEPAGPVAAASVFAVAAPNNDGRYNLFGNRANDDRWVANSWNESSPGAFRTNRAGFGSAGFALWPSSGSHVYLLESGPSQYRFVIDGNENAALATSGGYDSGAGVNWTIGDSAANNDQRFNGDIAELIFYNRVLSTDEVNAVGYYLKNKYGVAATYLNPNATAPENFVAIASDGIVALSWSRFIGATSYDVKRSSTQNGPYVSIGTTTETSLTDSQVVNGTPYYYVVSAFTTSETSNSTEISATPTGVDATRSTVVSSQPILFADGVAYTTITVTLLNANDVPMADKTVQLAKTSGTGLPNIQVVSDTTGDDGKATFIVDSQDVGTFVFTATDVTSNVEINQTATVEFAAATTMAINVNIDNVVESGLAGPAGGASAVWNTVGGASASGLKHISGPPTGVSFNISGTGGWMPVVDCDTNPTLRMLSKFGANFGANGTTQRLIISGLDSTKTYDLHVASAILISSNQCSRGVWSTTNTTSTTGEQSIDNTLDENGTTWVRGNNYVLFEDIVPDANGDITINGSAITGSPYDIRLPFNGFQLAESTTDPETLVSSVWNVNIGNEITMSDNFTGAAPENTVPNSFWNSVTANPTGLVLGDATASNRAGVTLTLTNGSEDIQYGGYAPVTGIELFSTWAKSSDNASPFTMTIGGLNASKTYDLVVYSDWYWKGDGRLPLTQTAGTGLSGTVTLDQISTGTDGIVPALVQDTDPLPNSSIEGNWLRISGLTPDVNGNLGFLMGGTNAAFNGFQLVYPAGVVSSGFTTWANANGASGQTAGEDHDNDGVPNGIEFFMGATGSSFTANATLNANNEIVWPASAAYQGTYEVQTSSDLVVWTPVATQPVPSGGFLTYSLPASAQGGKSFVRLFVAPTP